MKVLVISLFNPIVDVLSQDSPEKLCGTSGAGGNAISHVCNGFPDKILLTKSPPTKIPPKKKIITKI